MRIIAGTHRSRKLLSPPPDGVTRPITDRVKESMFDRLASTGMLGGGNVADVFSGTGSLGLEALSRGADHCTFVESHRGAVEMLKKNIQTLKVEDTSAVITSDAVSGIWLNQLRVKPLWVVFLDPPYAMSQDPLGLQRLEELIVKLAEVVEPEGTIVLRTDDHTQVHAVEGWLEPQTFNYGSMSLHFYVRPMQ